MADKNLLDPSLSIVSPGANDLVYGVTDPAGTPADGLFEVGSLGGVLSASTIWAGAGADLSTPSTSFADIDPTNLPALSLDLNVGDTVELTLKLTAKHTAGNIVGFDWLIDRPVSADTNTRGASWAAFLWEFGTNAADAETLCPRALFTVTEAGVHGFKPQWRVNSGTGFILLSSTYWTLIEHRVMRIGVA
jgi:hypothetical protein